MTSFDIIKALVKDWKIVLKAVKKGSEILAELGEIRSKNHYNGTKRPILQFT